MEKDCIGVFDSGVGGLTVLAHIRARLPGENLCYFADTAHMPYGDKSADQVREYSLQVVDILMRRGAKALVVACNTATAAAIQAIRESVDVPVIGMEPAIKPAVRLSAGGAVGVLATSGTISSEKFNRLMRRFAGRAEVIVRPCPGLVERIEAGETDSEETRALLQHFLRPLMEKGADTLVLGCTHYPLVMPLIRDIVGPDVRVIDTGEAIARELERQLRLRGLLTESSDGCGSLHFLTSGDAQTLSPLIRRLWNEPIDVEPV